MIPSVLRFLQGTPLLRETKRCRAKTLSVLALGLAVGVALAASGAAADTISYSLRASDRAAFDGALGTLTVDLTSPTTAFVTIDALDSGKLSSLVDGAGAVGVNVNGVFTVDNTSASNGAGGTASSMSEMARHLHGSGPFNLWLSSARASAHSPTEIGFALTAVGGNSWTSAAQVLMPNDKGQIAAIRIPPCHNGDAACVERHRGKGIAAFASGATPDVAPVAAIPIPAAAWLFGSGLLGLMAVARRHIKKGDSAAWKSQYSSAT